MGILHTYEAGVAWSGPGPLGTRSYTSYSRDHDVVFADKPPLPGSSDPAFRGDPSRYSPEELLVAALAQCHMLWFLHLCAQAGVVVVAYSDDAVGTMRVEAAGAGQFTRVVLRPRVTVEQDGGATAGPETLEESLRGLHARAHEHCFIARSVSFPVRHDPAPVRIVSPAGTAL